MIFKTLVLIGVLSSNVTAEHHLRGDAKETETTANYNQMGVEHLDLEVVNESGERELFPLLPGTKCPTGHHCRLHNAGLTGMSPMSNALKNTIKTPLAMTLDWNEFDKDMTTLVNSGNYCSRRTAMRRAAGLAAGMSVTVAMKNANAAETKEVKMGSDSGLLAFVPAKITICKGDTITWINNKAGPHNVVFDEDAVPEGVDFEKISMIDGEQLGEEGETFTRTFDTLGSYDYYCEPHRGAGMNGVVTVV